MNKENIFPLGYPGSSTYKGSVDYPRTIYQGYPGSFGYSWNPQAAGYPFLDHSNMIRTLNVNTTKYNKSDTSSYSPRTNLGYQMIIGIGIMIGVYIIKKLWYSNKEPELK